MKLSGLFLLAILIFSCKKPEEKMSFHLDGRSFLTLTNNTDDSARIQITNWYLLPWESQEIDTIIAPKSSFRYGLIMQNYNYYDLTIENVKYKIISRPGADDSIQIAHSGDVSFAGDLKEINEFLRSKSEQFNSVDADWMSRANVTADSNLRDFIIINDSITKVHVQCINNSKSNVPEWYRDFEVKRLKYLNAGWKLNSLLYRNRLLNFKDSIPENFLESTVGSLPVADEEFIGNMRYMYFLNDYIQFKVDPKLKKEIPISKEGWIEYINRRIEVTNAELSGLIKDVYLTFFLTNIIRNKKYLADEDWPTLVKNEDLRELLTQSLSSSPALPKGSELPYFHLPDSNNVFYQPSRFRGKIMLINFWATWCKPCIKEFPYENALVEEFKGEPVTVLNICMESEPGKWKEMIKKYGLKTMNLLAQNNWNEKLSKDFNISALPHSILIDWNGKVVQNKCPRASGNVNNLISDLLIKMKIETTLKNNDD